MRRREFIGFVGGVLASPITARAQQPAKVAALATWAWDGRCFSNAHRSAASRLEQSRVYRGQEHRYRFRFAKNSDQLQEFADQLVAQNVDIIFATSSTETGAARQATKTIPIVFATHADPVGTGHVASCTAGGNITGLSVLLSELTAKAIELLKEVVPKAKRFGVLSSPTVPSHMPTMRAAEAAAEKLGVTLHPALVRAVEEFEEAFAKIARADVQAVFVAASSLTVWSRPELFAQLALKYRLPSMFGSRDNVAVGELMSHAPDQLELSRRSAVYIDKILKGSKPADLPVEQASQYQLVINLKTAKMLGLTVPPTLLARADEVIE